MAGFRWLTFLSVIASISCQGPPPSDPSAAIILRIENKLFTDPNDKNQCFDVSNITVEPLDEHVSVIRGVLKINCVIDGSSANTIRADAKKKVNGRYETVFSHIICNMCDELDQGENSDYHMFLKYIAFPKECPIPEGYYSIDGMLVDTKDVPKSANQMGEYRTDLSLSKLEQCPPNSDDDVICDMAVVHADMFME